MPDGTELQAIRTRYFGPGNRNGSRIQAKAYVGTMYFNYQAALSPAMNHQRAADLFAIAKGWTAFGVLLPGSMPDGDTTVFVFSKSAPHDWRARLARAERESK